ncbi:hypothetical protein Tco_0944975, partial [Tanacetum coccineum]
MANVSKSISISNEELSNDTTPKAAKFVQDFQSLAKEANESLAKYKALELEIERLLRVVVSQDIMSIMQNNSVIDTSNLQTELEQCKYDKISYEKAYNDMQQKIEQLQAQLGDPKGKSKDTPCVSDTLDPLPQKLENENVELEYQVQNYEKENAHLKTAYKNLTSEQKDTTKGMSVNTQFSKQSILGKPPSSSGSKMYYITPLPKSKVFPKVSESNALSKLVTSNSVLSFRESTVVNNPRVIAPGIFRVNPFKESR